MTPPKVGFYSTPQQAKPSFDPGVCPCPVCGLDWGKGNVRTISLLEENGPRSLFYRLHRTCEESLKPEEKSALDAEALKAARS